MAETGTPDCARVVALIFTPLLEMGLARPRRMTLADFEAMQRRLGRELAHMSDDGLLAVRGWIEERAEGPLKNTCPSELTIKAVARGIEPEPDPARPLLGTYMRGPAGKRAWTEHPLKAVALYRFLKLYGPPTGGWSWRKSAAEREQISREIDKCRRLAAADNPEAIRALAGWNPLIDHVRSLVEPEDAETPAEADT